MANDKNNSIEHDHVERDVIKISPSVLDCKIRELEKYSGARANIIQDIGLVVTVFVVVASGGVGDFAGLHASDINGAFTLGLLFMITKTVIDIGVVVFDAGKSSRPALMHFLTDRSQPNHWRQFFEGRNHDK